MPSIPIQDLMRRTTLNLEFIEKHATQKGPFEVTQLINSFSGALAHSWEKLKLPLDEISIEEAEADGWPHVVTEYPSDHAVKTLDDLVHNLRNSFAHGNIQYLADPKGEIAALRIQNLDTRKKPPKRTWGALVLVRDIRTMLYKFVEFAEQNAGRSESVVRSA
jgi:hypothetical protein